MNQFSLNYTKVEFCVAPPIGPAPLIISPVSLRFDRSYLGVPRRP